MSFLQNRFRGWVVLLILTPEVLGQDPMPQRLPEPAAEAQKQSEKLIRDLFKEEYSKKAPADQQALARKLLKQGIGIKDDPPTRYVLFREAREIALKCGDVETTLAAITEMAKHYETDGLSLKAKALAAMVSVAKSPQVALALADVCLDVVDEAIQEEKFDVAKSLVSKAETAAKAARDATQTAEAQKKEKEIEALTKESLKAREASKILGANPADPEAALAVGRYLLMKGDGGKALPLLAKGSNPLLRAAAEKDLAAATGPEDQAAAGDAWLEAAEKEKNAALKSAVQGRAISCYESALTGLTGLAKTKIEKRLSALGLKSPTLSLDLGDGVSMDLVYIKPGVFMMGGNEAPKENWQGDERSPHRVAITRGFYIGKYEVTRAQFAAFVGATGHKTVAEREGNAWGRTADGQWKYVEGNTWRTPATFTQTDDHPVVCVSWSDAEAFCVWLAAKTKNGVRLPTEAEWEYACRAGSTTTWSFGDDESKLGDYGWYFANSGWQSHPVGQKKPNAWDLFDMYGNVWEWCQDWFAPYGQDAKDPEGPSIGKMRCLRGGDWANFAACCRSAFRFVTFPSGRASDFGFRVAVR